MYPARELTRLDARKAALLVAIERQRACAVAAVRRAARPLVWVDRAVSWWRRLPPLARLALVPVGMLARRVFRARARPAMSFFLRWLTIVLGAARVLRAANRRSRRSRISASSGARLSGGAGIL